MATALPRRALEAQRTVDPELAAFQQFFGTLAANPSVADIASDPLGGHIDLWVRLGDDDEGRENAIYRALAEYHGSEGVATPIDLHLVFADEPDSAFPAGLQPMFRRPR